LLRGGVKNILFLCTGNSARSIIAEAYMNAKGAPRWRAYSAGSKPSGAPNPYALKVLSEHRITAEKLRSKSWDEFAQPGAPQLDVVVTVCDNAAAETCPVWPTKAGQSPRRLHWPFADPAVATGEDAEKRAAFEKAYREISAKIDDFLAEETA